jgi:hypothetical protein
MCTHSVAIAIQVVIQENNAMMEIRLAEMDVLLLVRKNQDGYLQMAFLTLSLLFVMME